MISRKLDCSGVREPTAGSLSISAKLTTEVSGVRSSCETVATNSFFSAASSASERFWSVSIWRSAMCWVMSR